MTRKEAKRQVQAMINTGRLRLSDAGPALDRLLASQTATAPARAELSRADRDRAITAALADGKFPPSRRSHYERLWATDPAGTHRLLTASVAQGGLAGVGRPLASLPTAPQMQSHEEFMAQRFPRVQASATPARPVTAAGLEAPQVEVKPPAGAASEPPSDAERAARNMSCAELRARVAANGPDRGVVEQELTHREFLSHVSPSAARDAGYEIPRPDLTARGGVAGTVRGMMG